MSISEIWARSELDSLLCCAALREAGIESEIEFVNPLDVQCGSARPPVKSWMLNLPGVDTERHFDRNQWSDDMSSTSSETALEQLLGSLSGSVPKDRFLPWIPELKRWHRRDYVGPEIQNPSAVHSLAVLCDPMTGLGRSHDFIVSNYFFLLDLVEHLRVMTPESVLQLPDVQERMDILRQKRYLYEDQFKRTLQIRGKLLVQDMRDETVIYPGHPLWRFNDQPDASACLVMGWDKQRKKISLTLLAGLQYNGPHHAGRLMHALGGGGDRYQAVAQIFPEKLDESVQTLMTAFC